MNYWPGNAAKNKIMVRILETVRANPNRTVTILDYGCGVCAQWPQILRDHPNIRLIGFDPNSAHVTKARVNLAGLNAVLVDAKELEHGDFQADFIVSFSVLEHVYDRAAYLRLAHCHLSAEGRFYLNYDDGHFRRRLDLAAPETWPNAWRARIGRMVLEWKGRRGTAGNYKRRVSRMEFEDLLAQSKFKMVESFYSNLSDFKGLFKTVPAEKRDEFIAFWQGMENELNTRFAAQCEERYGDTTNLGHFMGSRTVVLARSDS